MKFLRLAIEERCTTMRFDFYTLSLYNKFRFIFRTADSIWDLLEERL